MHWPTLTEIQGDTWENSNTWGQRERAFETLTHGQEDVTETPEKDKRLGRSTASGVLRTHRFPLCCFSSLSTFMLALLSTQNLDFFCKAHLFCTVEIWLGLPVSLPLANIPRSPWDMKDRKTAGQKDRKITELVSSSYTDPRTAFVCIFSKHSLTLWITNILTLLKLIKAKFLLLATKEIQLIQGKWSNRQHDRGHRKLLKVAWNPDTLFKIIKNTY